MTKGRDMDQKQTVTNATLDRCTPDKSVALPPNRCTSRDRCKGGVGGVNYDRKGVVLLYGKRSATAKCRAECNGGSATAATVGARDSDKPSSPSGRARHGHETRKGAGKEKTTWMHIGAMNLIRDHEAGIDVPASKLELAKRLLGLPYAPDCIAEAEA